MSKRNRTKPAGQMNARDDGGLQGRAEVPGLDPAVAALIRSEIDARAAALQTEISARSAAAASDASTREGQDRRITEAMAAMADLRAQNDALRADMTALAARSGAPAASAQPARSNAAELASALVEAGLDLELCARGGWDLNRGFRSVNRPIDLSARAVTTIEASLVSALQPVPAAVGPFDLGVNLARGYANFIPELPPYNVLAVPYVREKQRNASGNIHCVMTAQTASGSAVLTVDTTAGVIVGSTLRIHDTVNGLIERKVRTVDSATQITCTDTMGQTVPTATSITCADFGTTAESNAKPAAIVEYETGSLNLQTLAHYIPVTQQAVATAPALEAMLQQMLVSGLAYTQHRHFAYGSGVAASGAIAGQLHGTTTSTTSPTHAWSAGAVGDTMFDAVLRAWAKLRYAAPATVHLNPLDLISMMTAKAGAAGSYVFPFAGGAVPGTLRTDGVISTPLFDIAPDWTMDQTDFHVVQHSLFSAKVRNPAMDRVAVGWINTQFINNQFTMLAEVGIEHLIQRPGACVIGEFDAAPGA